MRYIFFLLVLSIPCSVLQAQKKVYSIIADSVKITNCDSAELILENHTQGVKGFLYNTGNGRTIFKKGIVKINDSLYVMGADTFRYNAWLQGGNSFGTAGKFGTLDNNQVGLFTNNLERMRLTNTGRILINTTTDNGYDNLQVNGSIYNNLFTNFTPSSSTNSGAIRLRWGTGDGVYIGFYKQANFSRRAYIQTPSDARPMYFFDSVGFSFGTTPRVTVGGEVGLGTAKFSVVKPYAQTGFDVFNAGRTLTDTTTSIDLAVKSSGNVIIGGNSDNSYKLQVVGTGSVSINPNLSRSGDGIKIGGYLNTGDGQQALISTIGQTGGWRTIISERDGNIGIGTGSAGGWLVSNPPLRINAGGTVSIESQNFCFGSTGGPYNSSALLMSVSNTNEWQEGLGTYPNGQNYYFFGTRLGTPEGSNKRAPLKIGADQLIFTPGITDVEAARFSEAGYFGLGTTAPTAQLHTTGTVRLAGLTNDNTQTRVVVSDANGNLFYRTLSTWATDDVPRSSLAVNGPIRAKSLTLDAAGSWPDYVFDSSYRLPDLREVESFVKRHGHLPGIASAEEVVRSGINVGENQAALLKKVEELTLYALAQDRKLAAQGEEIDRLKKEMEEMKALIREIQKK